MSRAILIAAVAVLATLAGQAVATSVKVRMTNVLNHTINVEQCHSSRCYSEVSK
jgi:hypothetical protein